MTIDEARIQIDLADKELAQAFEKRMEASKEIARIKKENNLPIIDPMREREVLLKCKDRIQNKELVRYYEMLQTSIMKASKDYQGDLISDIYIKAKKSYPIYLQNGILKNTNTILKTDGKVFVLTDKGVPKEYVQTLHNQYEDICIFIIPNKEQSKSLKSYMKVLEFLVKNHYSKSDLYIGLGGGVVLDLLGFVCSTYLRGVPYNYIPTTLLSQVDASIGGKNGIDLDETKNIVGTINSPKNVLIDPTLIKTLTKRDFKQGMAEIIKMAVTLDKELFLEIEQSGGQFNSEWIKRAITIKQRIVEEDEEDLFLRHVLNFGHTIGHAIEARAKGKLLHGECVSIGMIECSVGEVKERLIKVLEQFDLPTSNPYTFEELKPYLQNDKKRTNTNVVTFIKLKDVADYYFEQVTI